ncbi:MAG: carboxypeptidase-like regulatory domain-containing protein [Crocinitomicaceae bacterium]
MLQRFVTLLILLCPIILFGQKITISGKVIDVEGDPVPYVTIAFTNSKLKPMKTDRSGDFSMSYEAGTEDSLKFTSIAFDPYVITLNSRLEKKILKKGGEISYEIVMPDRTTNIVTVRPTVPDTLIGLEVSVEDFEFLEDGKMILLTYEKNLRKGAVLQLMDENREELDKYYIQGEAVELNKDFRGNVHLICEERIYLVGVAESRFRVFLEDRDYYFKYVAPIIDTIGDNIYFSNYSEVYPAFDYYEFNRSDSSYNVILEVEDTFMMEFYRAEYKYVDVRTKLWAHQKQIETGIDKEIWVGATVFANSIYYNPVYAPLFKGGEDSLYVFDHYKNKLFKYRAGEGFVDSTRISYHLQSRKSGWEQPLIQDQENGKIYALFEKSGYSYLCEIDKNSGHVKQSFKLYFKYVDRIQIIDDKVYYVYRPFESVQKKFIYEEKLTVSKE